MAQVPEKVLAWLYSVLHEYRGPQRTYSDAARALSAHPTLGPRTEVYTYENGGSALLLTLSGTLPVTFRTTTYRFPVKLWIPQVYPQEGPIAYVTPGKDMIIRPGQHVGVDGRIYHPYLRDWAQMWDRASIAEFLEFLQQVFAKEPPVVSRAQQQQYQRPIGQQQTQHEAGTSPAPPQLPPKQRVGSVQPAEMPSADVPPPRPPKPGGERQERFPERTSSRNVSLDGPPLPPLPHERPRSQQMPPLQQYQNSYDVKQEAVSQALPPERGYPNGRPPGPPQPVDSPQSRRSVSQAYQQQRAPNERSPVSPVSPMNGYSELPETRYSQPPPPPQAQYSHQQPATSVPASHQPQRQHAPTQARQPYPQQVQPPRQYPTSQPYPPSNQVLQKPIPSKQPPPDLLSDPFDIALPGPSASGPLGSAPPIPPNPEKEHLLHALSTTLSQQAQQKVHQNLSALAPLQAQQHALRNAYGTLASELQQLDQLDQAITSNESMLHRSIQDCDGTIKNAHSKPQPPVDDVLVATSWVAQQLWTLSAEEAACREAMYVLQKAVDRGRVGGGDFVRQMRSLGRECFLKMVLARKCAQGLGLEVGGR